MTERLTFTVEEAGRLLGIGRGAAFAAVHSGELPSVRLGRRILVPRARLLALLGEQPATEGDESIEEGNFPGRITERQRTGDLTTALKPPVETPDWSAVLGASAPAKAAPAGPSHPIP